MVPRSAGQLERGRDTDLPIVRVWHGAGATCEMGSRLLPPRVLVSVGQPLKKYWWPSKSWALPLELEDIWDLDGLCLPKLPLVGGENRAE